MKIYTLYNTCIIIVCVCVCVCVGRCVCVCVCVCVSREAGDRAASSKRTQGDLRRMHHVFQVLMKISVIITLDVITYGVICNI